MWKMIFVGAGRRRVLRIMCSYKLINTRARAMTDGRHWISNIFNVSKQSKPRAQSAFFSPKSFSAVDGGGQRASKRGLNHSLIIRRRHASASFAWFWSFFLGFSPNRHHLAKMFRVFAVRFSLETFFFADGSLRNQSAKFSLLNLWLLLW